MGGGWWLARVNQLTRNPVNKDNFGVKLLEGKSPAKYAVGTKPEGVSNKILMICEDFNFLAP